MTQFILTATATDTVTGALGIMPAPFTVNSVSTGVPSFDHIVIVMMENHGYKQIIGSANAPYINSLVPSAALFTDSHGGPDVLHPSLPNYFQFFSGATQGMTKDVCPPTGQPYSTPNMASAVLAAGKTFGGYAESIPANIKACGPSPYAGRHVPWVWWGNVPASATHNFTAFPKTGPTGFGNLPSVSFVVPNLAHDMHSFGTLTDVQVIQNGDAWLKANIDPYAQWAKANNSLLILQWDEDNFTTADTIPTLFVGAHVQPGKYSEHITHYNVLRTILDSCGATPMAGAAKAAPITDCWK